MSANRSIHGPDRRGNCSAPSWPRCVRDAALQALGTRWVGRKGSWVTAFMEALATATPDQKKALGRGANELKKEVEAALAELETRSPRRGVPPMPSTSRCPDACRSSATAIRSASSATK